MKALEAFVAIQTDEDTPTAAAIARVVGWRTEDDVVAIVEVSYGHDAMGVRTWSEPSGKRELRRALDMLAMYLVREVIKKREGDGHSSPVQGDGV